MSKEIEFDAGHRVPDHASKCANPHGHRYRLRVTCEGQVVQEAGSTDDGMVVDFGDLKAWMTELVHDVLDHGFIVKAGDPVGPALRHVLPRANVITVDFSPTAENLARWCWERLAPVINAGWRGNMRLAMIELWETPTSRATYQET